MQYDLVFQGGGAKGMAFVGAMKEFERRGHTFRRLVGTSAGAINAALMAAGYTADQMAEALNETMEDGRPVFESFMAPPTLNEINSVELNDSMMMSVLESLADSVPKVREALEMLKGVTSLEGTKAVLDALGLEGLKNYAAYAYSFTEFGGIFSATHFVSWLERKLNERDERFGGATLRTLYEMTGNDVSLCVTDVTSQKLMVLNHRTAPDLPIIWAVRMSMSIPFVWPPVTWKSTWGTYTEGTLEHVISDHRIVDGGALSNFALRLTTSAGPAVRAVMSDDPNISEIEFAKFNARASTIGFMLDSSLEVPNAGAGPQSNSLVAFIESVSNWLKDNAPSTNFLTLGAGLLNTLMVGNDNFTLATQEDSVVRLPVGGIGVLEFDMTTRRKAALVDAASNVTKAFFESRADFTVNELFMAVGESGKFQIGASVNGEPNDKDWIGLFKSPEEAEGDVKDGNWTRVDEQTIQFDTITPAELGQYEARYYAFQSQGLFRGRQYQLVKSTGPLDRVVKVS